MVARFEVKGDIKAVLRDLDVVDKKVQKRATSMSINRVATKVKSAGIKQIASATNVPQKLIRRMFDNTGTQTRKDRVTIRKARPKWPSAFIYFRTRSIPAILLNARQTKTGVRTRRKVYPGAFINNAMGGGKQVFKRRGKARYPIDAQKVDIKKRGEVIFFGLVKKSGPDFRKEFDRNMRRLLLKVRR
jgi:hypothetical protein